eukprot:266756-Rhodomonas_salina.1
MSGTDVAYVVLRPVIEKGIEEEWQRLTQVPTYLPTRPAKSNTRPYMCSCSQIKYKVLCAPAR